MFCVGTEVCFALGVDEPRAFSFKSENHQRPVKSQDAARWQPLTPSFYEGNRPEQWGGLPKATAVSSTQLPGVFPLLGHAALPSEKRAAPGSFLGKASETRGCAP